MIWNLYMKKNQDLAFQKKEKKREIQGSPDWSFKKKDSPYWLPGRNHKIVKKSTLPIKLTKKLLTLIQNHLPQQHGPRGHFGLKLRHIHADSNKRGNLLLKFFSLWIQLGGGGGQRATLKGYGSPRMLQGYDIFSSFRGHAMSPEAGGSYMKMRKIRGSWYRVSV
jgi:hypothetical protein